MLLYLSTHIYTDAGMMYFFLTYVYLSKSNLPMVSEYNFFSTGQSYTKYFSLEFIFNIMEFNQVG